MLSFFSSYAVFILMSYSCIYSEFVRWSLLYIVLFIFYHSFLPLRVHYLITLLVDWEEEREICVISSNLIYTAIKQVLYGKNHTCFVQI